ncbi:MAG: type II secretion system F family protein [Phycisphaerales bacterium]|nr:type II secretion system F family protein [Phycisphaerales bacterium]
MTTTSAKHTFSYRARSQEGEVVTGTLSGTSPEEIAAMLRGDGLLVTAVQTASHAMPDFDAEEIRRGVAARRVRREDVAVFCQQLGVMLDTGVPLPEALESCRLQGRRKEFSDLVGEIHHDVCGGTPLSSSLARWPRIFTPIVVSLVRASEASGTMALMLTRLGEYLVREEKTRKQVRGAATYPAIMFGSALLITMFMLVAVLPKFAAIYQQRGADLPPATRIMMAIGDGLRYGWMYWVPAVAAILVGVALWRRTRSGQKALDWAKLSTPVIGRLTITVYLARASRTMSTLLAGGVGLIDVIRICRGVTNNVVFDRLWDDMEHRVRDGRPMTGAATDCRWIPPSVASMMSSGERSAKLPEVMEKIATQCDDDLESGIKKATSMIEPVLIVGMGILVGAVAMALLLPIFKMSSVVTG